MSALHGADGADALQGLRQDWSLTNALEDSATEVELYYLYGYPMISPYTFTPRARLLEFMRQAGNSNLVNLAAGLPSTECVPKADLKRAFDAALLEEGDVALGYHTPDDDYLLKEKSVQRI